LANGENSRLDCNEVYHKVPLAADCTEVPLAKTTLKKNNANYDVPIEGVFVNWRTWGAVCKPW